MSFQKRATKYHYIYLSFMLCVVVKSSVATEDTTKQTTDNETSVTTSEMTQSTLSSSEVTSTDSSTMTITSGNVNTSNTESTSMMSTEGLATTDITTTVSATNSITTTMGTDTTVETTTDQDTTENTTVSITTIPTTYSTSENYTDGLITTTTTTEEPEITTATNETVGTANTIATTQPSSVITTEPGVTTTETPDTTSEQSSDATTGMEPNTTTTPLIETTDVTTRTTTFSIIVQNITTEFTSTETQQTPTTTVTTTTTTQTTTKAYQVQPIYPNTENAVLEFAFELKFTDCAFNKTTIETKLSAVSNSVGGCKFIRVKSIKSCESGRKKRATSSSKLSVDAVFGIDAQTGATSGYNVSDELYFTLSSVQSIDVAYLNESKNKLTDALTSQKICDADVCKNDVIGRPGFVCVSESFMNNTQRCKILYYCDYKPLECGNNGQCYVETDMRRENVSYASKCRCAKEGYFRYEGTYCTEKVMTWELAVIICISASGGLILILLFVIIILCCRNASNSADVSFEESELMYTPTGVANTNQHKNGRNSGDSLKGVENRGYMEVRETADSGGWKPEDSANTYASIESKLRESNYNIQIKRPQVAQYKKSDEVTEF